MMTPIASPLATPRVGQTALPKRFDSYDMFGAKITPTTINDLLQTLDSHIAAAQQCVVASQNIHGLCARLTDPALRILHGLPQTQVHIDGMPLVPLCRLHGIPATFKHRVTLVDFFWPLLALANARGWRVFYLGATEAVLQAGMARIRERYPGLDMQAHHGFLDDVETMLNVDRLILTYQPHLVLVGMGMGPQERWILDHLDVIANSSVMTMGACMEYVAGVVGTPPRWMGRSGLEWLYRFAENPQRFWRRYLFEPWIVLAFVAWYALFPAWARSSLERRERLL